MELQGQLSVVHPVERGGRQLDDAVTEHEVLAINGVVRGIPDLLLLRGLSSRPQNQGLPPFDSGLMAGAGATFLLAALATLTLTNP